MLVVNPRYEPITETWFQPEYWGRNAEPVSAGGRGSAWFVYSGLGELVLRHYRRGGLVARISERSYVFSGWSNTRSVRELRLLEKLVDLGLPVPVPVAAWAEKQRLIWYHAALLIERIPDSVSLPESDRILDEGLWKLVGETVRRFHDNGLDHVDLNCDNILVAGDRVYLIDFDRCRLRRSSSPTEPWAKSNLDRLGRSMAKRLSNFSETQRCKLWQAFTSGYDAGLRF